MRLEIGLTDHLTGNSILQEPLASHPIPTASHQIPPDCSVPADFTYGKLFQLHYGQFAVNRWKHLVILDVRRLIHLLHCPSQLGVGPS